MTDINKKLIFEYERHINVLSAPNYNLPIIFKDIINGFKPEKSLVTDFSKILHSNNTKSNQHHEGNISFNNHNHRRVNSNISSERNKDKVEKEVNYKALLNGPKSLEDYNLSNTLNKIRKNNFERIKKIIGKENSKLQNKTNSLLKEIECINSKCTSVVSEKIEYIEETETLELEYSALAKEKHDLTTTNNSGNDKNSTDESNKTTPGHIKKDSMYLKTLPDDLTDKEQKKGDIKKLNDLKKYFKALYDNIEQAKVRAKEKDILQDKLKVENKELKEIVKQLSSNITLVSQEINHMKKYVNVPKAKTSVFSKVKSLFKKS